MTDRQPELRIGSYHVMNVTPPENALDIPEDVQSRAQVQVVLERDDGKDALEHFSRETFVTELSRLLGISAAEITVLKVEAGSIWVLVELPVSAAQKLYLMAGDTVQAPSEGSDLKFPSRTGQHIRGYELREQIGVGGFGAVYRAYQPNVLRDVAIKIILPSYASQPEFIERFEHEARLVARLEHMNIVPLYDFWRDDTGAYLVMRWLRGGNIRRKLKQGPLSPQIAARLVTQVSVALHFAHQQGVIHRDIKPDNILLDELDNAYLSDFGIAKDVQSALTGTGKGLMDGTPQYMSPEPFRGEPVTPLSDIYSLGIVLHELLTGQRPYGNVTMAQLVYKKLHEPLPVATLPNVHIPAALNAVIQRATAKDPASRYTDGLSLAAALERALQPPQAAGRDRDPAIAFTITPAVATPVYGKLKAKIYDRAELILEKPRRLIGRDAIIEKINTFLDENERILLQGLGGAGKTSLAATVVGNWIDSGKGNVLWIEAANENTDTLFEALMRALGHPAEIVNKTGDQRLEVVRRLLSDSGLLLVIDNVWNERALYEVMKAVPPNMPLLLTSRHSIPIDGEIIHVDELSPDAALELLNYHSRRDFTADTSVQSLIKLLGYHPFTLEIAGKRMKANRSISPSQLIENIKDAPHELDMPDNFADVGRKGVKDLLDASVAELTEDSRNLFTSIGGLFSPAASVSLLTLVADLDEKQGDTLLNDLQQRGLLERIPATDNTPPSIRLHDLTFSYARALYKEKHRDYQDIVTAVHAFVDDHAGSLDVLEFEQVNILGGAKAALAEAETEKLLDIMTALALKGYMDARGHTLMLLERLDDAINAARQMQPPPTETLHYLLGKRGNAFRDRGDMENALKSYHEALRFAPNATRQAFLLAVLGTTYAFRGDEHNADDHLRRAYQTAKSSSDDVALSFVLEHMGHHANATKDKSRALKLFEEALEVAERLDDPGRLFFALLNLGAQHTEHGEYAKALVSHERAYRIALEHDNHLWTANALQCIGEDYDGLGEREKAQTNLSAALTQFRSFGATVRVAELTDYMTQKRYLIEAS